MTSRVVNGENTAGIVPLDALYKKAMFGENPALYRAFNIQGYNPVADEGVEQSIWSTNNSVWVPLTSAEPLELVSDSANDSSGGTGAQAVYILGLDAEFNSISEVIELNGLTPVTTTKSFLRIQICAVDRVGTTNGFNIGTIVGTSSITANPEINILPGFGQCYSGHFTVPAGWTAFITQSVASVGSGVPIVNVGRIPQGLITYLVNIDGRQVRSPQYLMGGSTGGGFYGFNPIPRPIPEKSDFIAVFESGVDDAIITVNMQFILIKDDLPGRRGQIDTSTP